MPKGKVSIPKQLPNPSFFDVLILINPTLPPLHMAPRMRLIHTLMRSRAHERPHAHPRVRARGVHVDNVLHHGVVQQEPMDGPIATFDKQVLEAALVEALDACFAAVAGA